MARRVVLGIFHPTSSFTYPDPLDAVECFGSLLTAHRVFRRRACNRNTGTYYVSRSNAQTDWGEAGETAFMDIWFADTPPTEPYVPEVVDRRLTVGPRGGVREEEL